MTKISLLARACDLANVAVAVARATGRANHTGSPARAHQEANSLAALARAIHSANHTASLARTNGPATPLANPANCWEAPAVVLAWVALATE